MSTLDVARITLCQPADSPAADVLSAAQDEIRRLSETVVRAKNVQQRNGAKKKLNELSPLMAALEVEVKLTEYEKAVRKDSSGSAGERAAMRVLAQKLETQIAALPAGEERDVFKQWFADLNSSVGKSAVPAPPPVAVVPPPPPVPPTTPVPPPPPKIVTPAPPPPPLPPPRPTPPPVDPTIELFALLTAAEKQVNARPLVVTPALLRDLETLRVKIGALPSSTARTELQQRTAAVATALKMQAEIAQVREAVDQLERNAKQADASLPAVQDECERLIVRVTSHQVSAERMPLLQRLEAVKRALAERMELAAIESALQSCSAQIEKDPSDPAHLGNLGQVSARIQVLTDAKAKKAFTARIEGLQKAVDRETNEEIISTSLNVLKRECTSENVVAASIQAALELISAQVRQLMPGPARLGFEHQVKEVGELLKLDAKAEIKLQEATVLRLEPISGRSLPSARPLVFVARDRFAVGRKPDANAAKADFLTPSSEARISRVHVTFTARAGKIHVLAGEEGKPSTNPALLDETPLSSTPLPVAFDTERRIDLTGVLVLVAKQMPGVAPYGPPLYEGHPSSLAGSTMVMPPISGCLRLRPQGEDLLPNLAIWIFTDATIGAATTCAVTLPQAKLSPEHARIHYWKKSFWLETLRSGSAIQLSGKPLVPGAAQPLSTGQEIRLGESSYKLQLS